MCPSAHKRMLFNWIMVCGSTFLFFLHKKLSPPHCIVYLLPLSHYLSPKQIHSNYANWRLHVTVLFFVLWVGHVTGTLKLECLDAWRHIKNHKICLMIWIIYTRMHSNSLSQRSSPGKGAYRLCVRLRALTVLLPLHCYNVGPFRFPPCSLHNLLQICDSPLLPTGGWDTLIDKIYWNGII